MKHGDGVTAAFMEHRFAGYGFLTSDFFRGGEALPITRAGKHFGFHERAEIEWTIIPLNTSKPYVDCSHLKAGGYDVDLRRGRCVKQVNELTFSKICTILDDAGATRVKGQAPTAHKWGQESPPIGVIEGKPVRVQKDSHERSPAARRECIRVHGTNCTVCGMNF